MVPLWVLSHYGHLGNFLIPLMAQRYTDQLRCADVSVYF